MSFDDAHSVTRKLIEERDRLRVSSFVQGNKKAWCPICKVVLLIEDFGKTGFCKSCGQRTSLEEKRKEKTLTTKMRDSHSGPLIMSQPKRSRKRDPQWYDSINTNLSEEDKNDLRQAGFLI